LATIKLTDQLGLDLDLKTAGFSASDRYFRALPGIISGHGNLAEIVDQSLQDAAIRGATFGAGAVSVDRPGAYRAAASIAKAVKGGN
jgi:hypothetical protein